MTEKAEHRQRDRDSGVGVRLKVGGKYWEDWWSGVWEGLCPPQLGVWGLASRKQICAKNYAILSKFWYFFPILQQKVGGLSPQSWKWGTYPPAPPPCSDAYGPRRREGADMAPTSKHVNKEPNANNVLTVLLEHASQLCRDLFIPTNRNTAQS